MAAEAYATYFERASSLQERVVPSQVFLALSNTKHRLANLLHVFGLLVRAGLFCFGLTLIGTALAELLIPDAMHSKQPERLPRFVEILFAAGFLGYGVLLVGSPRWFAATPSAYAVPLAATVVLAIGATTRAIVDRDSGRLLHIAAIMSPAALAILAVRREAKSRPVCRSEITAAKRDRRPRKQSRLGVE